MMRKCSEWPIVLLNDDGIRPAGKPDQCFYCASKVGEKHGPECVCIQCLTRWNVLLNGVKVGVMDQYKAVGHSLEDWEFHLNESSWCADNAWDTDGTNLIKWDSGKVPNVLLSLPEDSCSCPFLSFEFVEVVDEGPFVEIEEH